MTAVPMSELQEEAVNGDASMHTRHNNLPPTQDRVKKDLTTNGLQDRQCCGGELIRQDNGRVRRRGSLHRDQPTHLLIAPTSAVIKLLMLATLCFSTVCDPTVALPPIGPVCGRPEIEVLIRIRSTCSYTRRVTRTSVLTSTRQALWVYHSPKKDFRTGEAPIHATHTHGLMVVAFPPCSRYLNQVTSHQL
jgi:hypothetical protein